ncbi:uncharacterized membrane protein (DUF485 family) [Mucilaginibacter sp. UYP25]|uniref:hypothetical protein n=1 Tax=unclassified Mucilaginibacter TaxID=2617802 RepID=UPI003398E1CD
METIKSFVAYNLKQLKIAFIITTSIMAVFIACMLFFGLSRYSLFDKITLPIGFGIVVGCSVVLMMILIGCINWFFRERYFNKHLMILIDQFNFSVRPYPKSVWELTKPALFGSLHGQEMVIELIEQKDLFIAYKNGSNDFDKKYGLIYRYKNLKKLGVENLVKELTTIAQGT